MFADDSNLFITSKNIQSLLEIANSQLSNLYKWISVNKLYINYEKTNFMLFEPYKRVLKTSDPVISTPLLFNGHTIERVYSVKYLGVFIDDKLNWVEHINYLINKVSSLTGILYRINHFLPLNCKRNIYFGLIHSVLTYCIEVYANVNKSSLKPLIIKCSRLLRMLQFLPRRTPLYDLYSTFGTLPIDLLFEYHTLKFMNRCFYDSSNIPTISSNLFSRGTHIHTHNTRHRDNFHIQSKFNPKSILFYGPSMWAKLPIGLQQNSSLNLFLNTYKQHLLNSMRL